MAALNGQKLFALFDFFQENTVDVGDAADIAVSDPDQDLKALADGKTIVDVFWHTGKGGKKLKTPIFCKAKVIRISENREQLLLIASKLEKNEITLADAVRYEPCAIRERKRNKKYDQSDEESDAQDHDSPPPHDHKQRAVLQAKNIENLNILAKIPKLNIEEDSGTAEKPCCCCEQTNKNFEDLRQEIQKQRKLIRNLAEKMGHMVQKEGKAVDVDEKVTLDGNVILPIDALSRLNKSDEKKLVQDFMDLVFKEREMAKHSLTGRATNALKDSVAKPPLDQNKVAALRGYVRKCFPNVTDKLINSTITAKCNNATKAYKKRKDTKKAAKRAKNSVLTGTDGEDDKGNDRENIED